MTSALFKEAITGSHTRVGRIELWDQADRLVLKSLPFKTASVEQTDVTAGVVAKLTATFPASTDRYLNRMGIELRPFAGVNLGSGPLEMYPLGCFPTYRIVTSTSPDEDQQVTAEDRYQWIVQQDFDRPVQSVPGLLITDQIVRLYQGTGKFTTVNVTATSTQRMTDITWDAGEGSRHNAIADLCEAIGAQTGIDRAGVPYLRNRPVLGSSSFTYEDGEGGTRITWVTNEDAEGVHNAVTFYCSNPDPANQFEAYPCAITDIYSPAYKGKIGHRPMAFTDPNVTTRASAKAAAQKKLTREAARSRQHSITCLASVERQPGQTIGLKAADGSIELAMIQTVTHPLDPEGQQQITTVNTRADEDSGL